MSTMRVQLALFDQPRFAQLTKQLEGWSVVSDRMREQLALFNQPRFAQLTKQLEGWTVVSDQVREQMAAWTVVSDQVREQLALFNQPRFAQLTKQLAGWSVVSDRMREQLALFNQPRFAQQLTGLARLHIQGLSPLEGFESYRRQFDSILERLPAASPPGPEEAGLPTGTLPHVRPPAVDWPPIGSFAVRVLLAAITLALAFAVWEEGKDTAPAATFAVIYCLFAAWHDVDKDL